METAIGGRTALVCASTSGLGWAIAQALDEEGANVVLCGRRAQLAQQRAARLTNAIGVGVDLAEPTAAEQLVTAAKDHFGGIDILVLNSGGPAPSGVLATDDAAMASGIDVLVHAMHRLILATVPEMRARGWGRVVSVGSSGVQQPIPGLAVSNAARGALAGLLKTLADEVAADGVTVNMVLPGRIATDRLASLDAATAKRSGKDVKEVQEASERSIPIRRYGRPDEFAAVVAFLCSAKASYVTGSQIRADGGLIRAT